MDRQLNRQWVGALEYWRYPARRDSWGGPLNGQRGRTALLEELLNRFAPTLIVETGTFRGTTTRWFADTVPGARIVSFEMSRRLLGFARMQLWDRRAVALRAGDSRALLRELIRRDVGVRQRTFFYLDAHWGADLPLVEELETVFSSCAEPIVAVDDFEVPGEPGYGFDDYGSGKALTLATIRPLVERFGLRCFYPSLPANAETGARRGLVVLAAEPRAVDLLRSITGLREVAP